VKNENNSGVCFEITTANEDLQYKQSRVDHECEGHWKLHMETCLELCSDDKIEIAYDIFPELEKYYIASAKLVAPYSNVNIMRGNDFTASLKKQCVSTELPNQNSHQFICEMEGSYEVEGIPV
jgi:hypothetical protein